MNRSSSYPVTLRPGGFPQVFYDNSCLHAAIYDYDGIVNVCNLDLGLRYNDKSVVDQKVVIDPLIQR